MIEQLGAYQPIHRTQKRKHTQTNNQDHYCLNKDPSNRHEQCTMASNAASSQERPVDLNQEAVNDDKHCIHKEAFDVPSCSSPSPPAPHTPFSPEQNRSVIITRMDLLKRRPVAPEKELNRFQFIECISNDTVKQFQNALKHYMFKVKRSQQQQHWSQKEAQTEAT